MKKLGIMFLAIIAVLAVYLSWSYFSVSGQNNANSSAKHSAAGISVAGKKPDNFQASIADYGEKGINAAKYFAVQISGAAGNALNGIIDNTKNTIKKNLDNILETTSSPATDPSLPVVLRSGTAAGSPQSSSSEPEVCFAVSKGDVVGYGISQPFSGLIDVLYGVDWGDGKADSGVFQNGAQNVFVSHSYAQQGNYSVIFAVKSSSTALTVSRSVCVR